MSLTQAQLESFYEGIVVEVRAKGGVCAITRGMACIEFGVAQTTNDCDLLCEPRSAQILLAAIASTELTTSRSRYRGHLSPPLDARWLGGGWTSHFYWKAKEAEAYLDVFGVPPRGSTPWAAELRGLYVSPHTVAEMKRTDRERDWPFATALGTNMLDAGDLRGWLHVFDFRTRLGLLHRVPCPQEMVAQRPVLDLAFKRDRRLEHALHVEKVYWNALDRARLRVYERAARPYAAAVRKAKIPREAPLEAATSSPPSAREQPAAPQPAARLRPGRAGSRRSIGREEAGAGGGDGLSAGYHREFQEPRLMKRSRRKPRWLTPSVRRHIRRLAYEFQVRAFGEEMARVNFLPLEKRKAYVREMMDHARAKGVKFVPPARGVTR